jgi:hypothetical protein
LNLDLNFYLSGHHTSRGKFALPLSSLVELRTNFDQNGLYKMMIPLNV